MKSYSSKLFFMAKTRRKRCPHCGFLEVIKWGRRTNHRCLAHIQRECLTWITKHPQSKAGKELREIVCKICSIKTVNNRLQWTFDFHA